MNVTVPIAMLALLLPLEVPVLVSGAVQQEGEVRQRETPEQTQARRRAEERELAERAQQQAILRGMARGAVSMNPRRDPTGTDANPARSTNRALSDLMALAAELQGLVDLRSTTVMDDRVREELSNRSQRSLAAAQAVIGFINRDSRVSPPEPGPVPDENLDNRLSRLASLYLELLRPTVELISGDVLDVRVLDEVRRGFATMAALIEAVPESDLTLHSQ